MYLEQSSAIGSKQCIRQALHDVHVILPAYNEERSLPTLLRRIEAFAPGLEHDVTVWVVDDGSSDHTAGVAESATQRLDVRVVRHARNLGLGQAVRTGLATVAATARQDDAVVIMDADDTHDVSLIDAMVAGLESGHDIAIASRFVGGGDDSSAPLFRRFLSRAAAWLFRFLLPIAGIHDFTSGYRAYRVSLLQRAISHYGERLVEEQGFAVMVELLLKLRHYDPRVVEVPLKLRYDRKATPSSLRLGRTIAQYVRLGLRDRLSPPPFRVL